MLAFAMAYGFQGVPPELISATTHDPTFGACLSPTEAASKMLRPQRWYPVYIAGKVWLSKTVAPLSEDEVAMRIQAGDHNASQGSAGSARSSASNTYAPRNINFPTNSGAYNEVPDSASDPRTPILTRASSRGAQSPITPKRNERAAAENTAMRPLPMHTPKSKPRAVHQVVNSRATDVSQVPEYQSFWQQIEGSMTQAEWDEMDEELRIHWATNYLEIGDD